MNLFSNNEINKWEYIQNIFLIVCTTFLFYVSKDFLIFIPMIFIFLILITQNNRKKNKGENNDK